MGGAGRLLWRNEGVRREEAVGRHGVYGGPDWKSMNYLER